MPANAKEAGFGKETVFSFPNIVQKPIITYIETATQYHLMKFPVS